VCGWPEERERKNFVWDFLSGAKKSIKVFSLHLHGAPPTHSPTPVRVALSERSNRVRGGRRGKKSALELPENPNPTRDAQSERSFHVRAVHVSGRGTQCTARDTRLDNRRRKIRYFPPFPSQMPLVLSLALAFLKVFFLRCCSARKRGEKGKQPSRAVFPLLCLSLSLSPGTHHNSKSFRQIVAQIK
jgi:hypothetical protein